MPTKTPEGEQAEFPRPSSSLPTPPVHTLPLAGQGWLQVLRTASEARDPRRAIAGANLHVPPEFAAAAHACGEGGDRCHRPHRKGVLEAELPPAP
eukprot:scaffold170030_cov28-Tisochrysis_lutea.AAC.1